MSVSIISGTNSKPASSALMAPMTERFVSAIKRYAERNGIDVVTFRRGERKDERTRKYLDQWSGGLVGVPGAL